MASIFPLEANIRAVFFDMSPAKAARNATSELKGRIVAAKKAEVNKKSSCIANISFYLGKQKVLIHR
jgi:hypothetical protein